MKVYGYILLLLAVVVIFMFSLKDNNAPGCKKVVIPAKDTVAVVLSIEPGVAGNLLRVKSIPRGEESHVWEGDGDTIKVGDTIQMKTRIVERIPRIEGFKKK